MAFKKNQRVSFTRQHDRSHTLTGSVVEVKDQEILIAADPDGVAVWANAADVTASAEEKTPAEVAAPADEEKPRAPAEVRHKKSA